VKDKSNEKINALLREIIKELNKPQPTIEQKARKKAEEMWNKWLDSESYDHSEAIYQALLIDPKTL
jgi:vacuolar-type H+-ATPase subunit E/Vma4